MELSSRQHAPANLEPESTARQEVFQLLAEWRRLTELESAAIGGENWGVVAEHQNNKDALREALTSARQRQRTHAASADNADEDAAICALVAEVLALERANAEVLATKRQRRQEELHRVTQANLQVHGLRRAYGNSTRSCWQSYS